MHVEDSYEGALRRLQRLGHAARAAVPPPPARDEEREHDLEELARLACDENEALKEQLDGAQAEISRLRNVVATLQESLSQAQANAGDDQPYYTAPKRRGGEGLALFSILSLVAGAALVIALKPFQAGPAAFTLAASAPALSTPTVMPAVAPTATTPAPHPVTPTVVKPSAPAPATTVIPKATTIPPVAPPVARAEHHHAAKKQHAAKKAHEPKKHAKKGLATDTSDPLGGISL